MSLKKWFKVRRLAGFVAISALLFSLVSMFVPLWKYPNPIGRPTVANVFFFFGSISCMCAIISFIVYDDYQRKIFLLLRHLNEDDLRPYMELSPSAMEDLCLRRLKVLGCAWDDAIKNHPMPFADERVDAESAFRRAYWFFRENKFIKPTKWDRFFPQPETQK